MCEKTKRRSKFFATALNLFPVPCVEDFEKGETQDAHRSIIRKEGCFESAADRPR